VALPAKKKQQEKFVDMKAQGLSVVTLCVHCQPKFYQYLSHTETAKPYVAFTSVYTKFSDM